MDQNTAGGLLLLVIIIVVIYNWKAIAQALVSLAVVFIRIGTVVGGIVMFFGIKSMGEAVGILILMVIAFWFADWLDNSFGLEDKASSHTPPVKGGSFPGTYSEPKKECPYCQGSRRIRCDRVHEQGNPNNPYPMCWKCGNSGYMACPHCP